MNNAAFGDFLDCESYSESSGSAATCNESEAETLLFVDWEEIEQYRTNCFRFMDSTAIRIRLKQKIVDVDGSVVGWNHLMWDGTRSERPVAMGRGNRSSNGDMVDLFRQILSGQLLLNPTLDMKPWKRGDPIEAERLNQQTQALGTGGVSRCSDRRIDDGR